MSDLVTWLRAQLDEDIELASRCSPTADLLDGVTSPREGWRQGTIYDECADLAAKSALVHGYAITTDAATRRVLRFVFQALALPYADREGFCEEWRPPNG